MTNKMTAGRLCGFAMALLMTGPLTAAAQDARTQALKSQVVREIDTMKKMTQVVTDQIFSFGELGFQEYETAKYVTGLLEKEGFKIERGIGGMPTAWVATYGSGKPVIALGADIDCIPQASQKPGVAYRDPIVAGAPGHGEGHNAGLAVNVTAALAVKKVMERERLSGTIKLLPGIAEELLGAKAYYVRAGTFNDVDVVMFAHVDSRFGVAWGQGDNLGLVSVEFQFKGEAAHAGGAPWRGKSALDAVELMNTGWNFKREHLRPTQRSHYVISDGGDQPNVVPSTAAVWYYFREADFSHVKELWEIAEKMAQGAALMTGTTFTSRVLGSAWPQHYNKPIAEAMNANIQAVGMPEWSEDDQRFARAIQREMKSREEGLPSTVSPMRGPVSDAARAGGSSNDLGDITWVVPTVLLRYPANVTGLPGHHWASAMSMATPIAHKGATAGAKVQALTMVDILTRPQLVADSKQYFADVQTKDVKYTPLIRPQDQPAVWSNERIMREYREKMRPFYYQPAKYSTYMEQLGVRYPTIRGPQAADASSR